MIVGLASRKRSAGRQAETGRPRSCATCRRCPPTGWRFANFARATTRRRSGEVTSFALPPMLRRGKLPRATKAGKPKSPSSPAPTLRLPPLTAAPSRRRSKPSSPSTGFHTLLLHGVTGSGKTEVYLRAIDAVLARGGQALMLVPEIALTPQLEGRVAARFPGAHIVCAQQRHGRCGARARLSRGAGAASADIVLGTRLAVFMPMPRLQLIVVDEEHDASFKQQDGLRYSARDVAIWRAQQRDIPIVLGSATPSLETFHHARTRRATRLLELPERAVAEAMPAVRIVDTRREKLQDGLSAALLAGIEQRLARGEQSLVFLNRRGYAPVLACPPCGWISRCTRCAANLVLHLADRRLRCHHCGFETRHSARLPGLRQRRSAALRARHAAARDHARRALSRGARAAHRPRFGEHAEEMAGAARHHPRRRGRHPGRHADAGQGPRLSAADAGRRDRRRCRPVRRRLPRARSACSRS